jgi:hypothetical protein
MTPEQRAHHLFQNTYYDNIDRGDMKAATEAFHPDVAWSHAQVWAHHEFEKNHPAQLNGRAEVEVFLAKRAGQLSEATITHHVRKLVINDNVGAFLGAVEGPGPEKEFIVWFELADNLVKRYTLRPV